MLWASRPPIGPDGARRLSYPPRPVRDVRLSAERSKHLGSAGRIRAVLSQKVIMAAVGRSDRNAVDQLLHKRVRAGHMARVAITRSLVRALR